MQAFKPSSCCWAGCSQPASRRTSQQQPDQSPTTPATPEASPSSAMFSSMPGSDASSETLERCERTEAESLCALSLCTAAPCSDTASALMERDSMCCGGAAAAGAWTGTLPLMPTPLLADGGPLSGPGWPADPTAAIISFREDAVRETGPLATLPYSLPYSAPAEEPVPLPAVPTPPAAASAASLRELTSALSLRMESK